MPGMGMKTKYKFLILNHNIVTDGNGWSLFDSVSFKPVLFHGLQANSSCLALYLDTLIIRGILLVA